MAAITTAAGASGNWENPATWSTGTIPTSADDVTVGNQRFTISAMSGGAGADIVCTATGHTFVDGDEVVLGNSGVPYQPLVCGMPYFIVSAATNIFKLALTPGGTPITTTFGSMVAPLDVAKKYVLTLDSAPASSRICLSLTLQTGVVFRVSTTAATQIQVDNNWSCKPGAVLDCDISAYPSIVSRWKVGGNSAGTSYGLFIDPGSNFHKLRGKQRKRRANLTSSLTANTTTSFDVDDATGWEPGDQLVLSATQPRNGSTTIKTSTVTIDAITPGAGTAATITFFGTGTGGNTTPNLHLAGGHVGNFSSNLIIESVNKGVYANRGFVYLDRGNGSGANSRAYMEGNTVNQGRIFIEDVRFDSLGCAYNRPSLYVAFAGDVYDFTIGGVNNNVFYDHGGGLWFEGGGTPCATPTANNVAVQLTIGGGNPFMFGNIATEDIPSGFASFWATGNYNLYFNTGSSITVDDFVMTGANWGINTSNGAPNVVVKNSQMYCVQTFQYATCAKIEYIDCDFSKFQSGVSNPPNMQRQSGNGNVKFTRCLRHSSTTPISADAAPVSSMNIHESEGGDASFQKIYTSRSGNTRPAWERDNALVKNSLSSIKGYYSKGFPLKMEQEILTASGTTARVVGYMRKNAAYGSTDLPYVEIEGFGVSVRATMSDVNDTWEKFTLDYMQSSGGDGKATLRFVNSCPTTTGNCWLSGVTFTPFVTRARHYGYTFDEPNPLRFVNTALTVDEATASAYTGVTITGTQLTVGAGTANTWAKVYAYSQYYYSQGGETVNIASSDGQSFVLPLTYKLSWPTMGADGTLSGGWLLLPSAGTYTHKLSGTKIEFQAAGTYDMSATQFSGSVEFVNTSGGAVTVSIPSGFTPVNTGPSITLSAPVISTTIAAQVSLAGAEIRIYDLDNSPAGSLGTELAGTESCPGSTFSFSIAASNNVWVQIMLAGYKEYGQQITGPAASTTFTVALTKELDA